MGKVMLEILVVLLLLLLVGYWVLSGFKYEIISRQRSSEEYFTEDMRDKATLEKDIARIVDEVTQEIHSQDLHKCLTQVQVGKKRHIPPSTLPNVPGRASGSE
jgi:biopolymer transport protein ExbB/TolQ